MFITVISSIKFKTKTLMIALLIGLALVAISVYRAHRNDFILSRYDVLREKDKMLIEMSKTKKVNEIVKKQPEITSLSSVLEYLSRRHLFRYDTCLIKNGLI